jgi:hypothetical protein
MSNLAHEGWKTELADGLSDLVEHLRQLDEKIRLRLDYKPRLSSDSRERLADLQRHLCGPQSYFTEAAGFVRRWL